MSGGVFFLYDILFDTHSPFAEITLKLLIQSRMKNCSNGILVKGRENGEK